MWTDAAATPGPLAPPWLGGWVGGWRRRQARRRRGRRRRRATRGGEVGGTQSGKNGCGCLTWRRGPTRRRGIGRLCGLQWAAAAGGGVGGRERPGRGGDPFEKEETAASASCAALPAAASLCARLRPMSTRVGGELIVPVAPYEMYDAAVAVAQDHRVDQREAFNRRPPAF